MATRFYLNNVTYGTSAAVNPSFMGWTSTASAVRLKAETIKHAGVAVTKTLNVLSGASEEFICFYQYVSNPLDAQTISGTLKGQLRCLESNVSANATVAVGVQVCSQDGTSITGTVLAISASDDTSATPPEISTSATNRSFNDVSESASITLSSLAINAGDRLIIEIGFRELDTTTSRSVTGYFGGATASGDLPEDNTTTTANLWPWVEFSGTITELGPTVVTVTEVTATGTIPTVTVPTNVGATPVTATGVIPAVTVVSSIIVLPDPVYAIGTVPPDVIAGSAVIAVNPVTAVGTIPTVTVTLPCIVYPTVFGAIGVILDPSVVAGEKSIYFSANGMPSGKTMYCKIVDDLGNIIRDWSTVGVIENVVDVTADYYDYYIGTNKVNGNFQGRILWKTGDAVPYVASETINVYQTYVDIIHGRLTVQRASNLDNLDATMSSRFPTASYTAPDNAGIAANGAAIATKPTLANMLTGGVAKESTLTGMLVDLGRLLGLSMDNQVEDDFVRDINGNLIGSTTYCYDSSAHATTHDKTTGLVFKFTVTGIYSANKLIKVTSLRVL